MHKIFTIIILFLASCTFAQSSISTVGQILRLELNNSPFPHEDRANGYKYKDDIYSAADHYSDSTTLVFIPEYFDPSGATDIVVYFHGWNNNVDSMIEQFDLVRQFYESRINAILVMPEGPKNAPDSFGGKLEEKNMFFIFISEIFDNLNSELDIDIRPGKITLSGHSGAYRIMSYILMRGGLNDSIEKVILFDALYADTEKYAYWLDHYNGKFIDIYTPHGGTKRESENLMECLTAWDIPYIYVIEDELTDEVLNENRIVFIASQLSHNEVIYKQEQFTRFLKSN